MRVGGDDNLSVVRDWDRDKKEGTSLHHDADKLKNTLQRGGEAKDRGQVLGSRAVAALLPARGFEQPQVADEQRAGRLDIAPSVVSTSSELRTAELTARIEGAFGVRPFDFYGTTEGLWGVECEHHDGLHLFEDWCIAENVDAAGRPVPDGEPGARLLVTNLYKRTLPLIRFEVSDVVVLDRTPCACGRTLPRLRGCSRQTWHE